MIWNDSAFLISKNKYNENSIISEFYTMNYGKVSGIIFGATSKKIKNYLQIGNRLHLNYFSKSINKMGYFKIEIEKAYTPFYFDNNQKLLCITSALNLIKILTVDLQKNEKIFYQLENFYEILNLDNWIQRYIYWELELFKNLGYDLELKNLVDKKIIDNRTEYVSKSSYEKKTVPNFLIDKNDDILDVKMLLSGLKLVGDYLEKSILRPNSLNQPLSRIQFINTLK